MDSRRLFRSLFTGDTAEGEDVCDGVAAQAVAGMDAAGHLTGSPQAFNDGAVFTQDLSLSINADTAHGVMQGSLARADADAHGGIGFDGVDIDEMYQKMARLRLHVETFKDCVHSGTVVEEARMIGAYRIYYGSAETDHPDTAEVFKRWIAEVPYTYSTIRIPQKALLLPPTETCRADTGLGMLSDTFRRINETFRESMEYSPPCKCIQGNIETRDLERIPCTVLTPFVRYLEEHDLIPLGNLYGWVVYSPVNHKWDSYRISLRIGVS